MSQAPGNGRTVALTFDDGPGRDTPALLDLLRGAGVHATFFMIGNRVAMTPSVVARAAREGHLIGDHSWHHAYPQTVPGGWTARYLNAEVGSTRRAISLATGEPVCWFRPPGGYLTPAVLPTTGSLGMSVALWSVDPQDWKLQGAHAPAGGGAAAAITSRIVTGADAGLTQPHPVILMHDGGGWRGAGVAAVARLIAVYRAHGYRFVRLDGLD